VAKYRQDGIRRRISGMANILIFGGLGYIGSALCELYRNEPRHKVTVLDNRFIPERIAGFPPHFRFVHADIADLDLMAYLARDAEIAHFLAAQVEAESSAERSEAVWRDNFELPKSVIERITTDVRVVFPSSGNVFGGTPEGAKWQGLTEDDRPHPKLPYAETKREMENFLNASNRNFTILRFGTNYGYSPGMRFNLVTNIFLKRALEGQPIQLHGGGRNWRPTACVTDCARALIFVAERRDTAGETFHVVSGSFPIRQLAEQVLALTGSESKLVIVEKAVPFNSYALSSDKIKNLGFTFEWPLDRAISEAKRRLAALASRQPPHRLT
jgi:UDP-glucose 4-epimerase